MKIFNRCTLEVSCCNECPFLLIDFVYKNEIKIAEKHYCHHPNFHGSMWGLIDGDPHTIPNSCPMLSSPITIKAKKIK